MPKLVVLYPQPTDPMEFEKLFMEEHLPLVLAQMPAVVRYEVGRVVGGERGVAPYYWITQLHFENMEALMTTTASPGAQRASGHARQISTGGPPTMFVVEEAQQPPSP